MKELWEESGYRFYDVLGELGERIISPPSCLVAGKSVYYNLIRLIHSRANEPEGSFKYYRIAKNVSILEGYLYDASIGFYFGARQMIIDAILRERGIELDGSLWEFVKRIPDVGMPLTNLLNQNSNEDRKILKFIEERFVK
jgi:hypothetical protein